MTVTLKAHWITTLSKVGDAGRDGIRAADVDSRTAAALERRELVTSFEKQQYAGLNEAPGKTTWYRLTDAGRDWLVEYRENPNPSRALPDGWTMIGAGNYLHTASRVEVRRDGRRWGVLHPLGPVTEAAPRYELRVDEATTRAAAFVAAARIIPAQVEFVQAATFEATGRPETWPAGQADEPTVDARHLAVRASGARTGYQARQGDRVIQLETGDRGFYVTGEGEGDCSYVMFDGETHNTLVHPNDLVVIVEPREVRAMQVTRAPKYPDYTELGGADEPGEDYYLLVDGKRIGSTYWCGADDVPDGQRWASFGPAGLSRRHRTREDAEQVQIREYATNPDLYDRYHAEYQREEAAKLAKREAELAEWEEQRRIDREGADEPGPTVWELPAWHNIIAEDQADVRAVKAWLDAHDLDNVSAAHPIRIEQRAERRVIVVQQARQRGLSRKTETRVVTCIQDPPVVDLTPRPDLVALLDTHYPTKFPLIDFGQNVACGPCTRAYGSAAEVVLWECPVFAKARELGAARAALETAERDVVAAADALQIAETTDRDITPEKNRLTTAEINFVRRMLAVTAIVRDPAQDAEVRFVMISSSGDDGSTWRPEHWLGVVPLERETAAAQALRYATTRYLTDGPENVGVADPWERLTRPRPFRVEVFTNPMGAEPNGVWTNLTDPCRRGRHHAGAHPVATEPARPDGTRVETVCCARCFHRVWRLASGVWMLEGDPLPGLDDQRDSDSDPRPNAKVNAGPGPDDAEVSFGYRIETRTGRRWRTVRVGNTPPMYRRDPAVLWAAADTILGNARQVLGLGSKDPMPGVRVRAWDRQSGHVQYATRRASRKVNQRA